MLCWLLYAKFFDGLQYPKPRPRMQTWRSVAHHQSRPLGEKQPQHIPKGRNVVSTKLLIIHLGAIQNRAGIVRPHPRRSYDPPLFLLSHHYALFVVLLCGALLDLSSPRRNDFHRCPTTDGSPNRGQACFRSLVSRIGRLDVPNIGFQDVSPTANAHFGVVAHSVLRFDIAW